MESLLTTKDIAHYTNRSVRAIQMNSKVDQYLESYERKSAGRPAALYNRNVLKLWGLNPMNNESLQSSSDAYFNNSKRSDYDTPRTFEKNVWDSAVKVCKERYLSMPKKNLSEACRMTVSTAKMNGIDLDYDKFYNKMSRPKSKTSNWDSPYHRENWKMLHDTVFKFKKNAIDNHPFTSYNMFAMFNHAGLLEKGRGSRRVIVVDDFKRDVWVDDNGEMSMPWGLLFIDGITNYPLMCIPAETIDTDTIAAGILMTAFSHGINEDTVWVFETSRAMNNPNIKGLIKSLYTPEQLEAFKVKDHWVKKLFPGQTAPYVNSPSQIAQSIFKSKVERSIKNFKDEFDGVYFPTAYQGGDRKEGVELDLSGSPLAILSYSNQKPGAENPVPNSKKLLPIKDFWTRFQNWIWGKYINVPRTDMYKDFCNVFNHKRKPSIKEVHAYFTSENDGSFKPSIENIERFAYIFFFAQSERHKFTVKVNRIGQYQTEINKVQYSLRCDDLNESHVGNKVCTIPTPFAKDEFLVFDVTNFENPEYIGIAHNTIATTLDEARQYQIDAQRMRESNTKRMRKDAEDHYVTIGDDFEYESTPPTVEDWTQELAANKSKLIATDEQAEEIDEYEEIEEIQEYKPISPKMKKLNEMFGDI